jgi:hypothetical protein
MLYYIDNGPQTRVRAQVNMLGVVSIPLADSRALFESFKRGRRLFVVDSRERFGFDLANSSKALAAVDECVQRHSYPASGPGPSFGPAPGPAPAPLPPPPDKAPDTFKGGAGTRL